jgi:hypothetical protein
MKGWQSILDLFPDEVRKALAGWRPVLNLNAAGITKTVDAADITDEGALNALSDFLTNKLPTAAWGAYKDGFEIALKAFGVGAGRMVDLFTYWGTLQGKELQDAVRTYITTMVEAVRVRDLFRPGSFDTRLLESRKPNTALSQIDDLDAKMAAAVARMAKLTDIDDLTAAQQEINQMARDRYEMELEYLRQIDAIQKGLNASHDQLDEQLRLQGMGDQQKMDFFYQRLAEIRAQMQTETDPTKIADLDNQAQRYIQAALGLDPNNKENQDKLRAILADLGAIANANLDAARKQVEDRDARPASLLEQAAQMLMDAAADLSGVPKPPP